MPSNPARRILTAALALGALAAAPAAASAATSASVTGDAGAQIPVTPGAPPTIRNIDPKLLLAFPAAEATEKYSYAITGPAGEPAGFAVTCLVKKDPFPTGLYYRGNGNYTITVTSYAANDRNCATPIRSEPFVYVVGASVPITGPATFSLRSSGSSTRSPIPIAANLNPGAGGYELRYALNGQIGPDGGIVGGGELGSINSTTGQAQLFVTKPGTYTVVARAKGFGGSVEAATPWSAPIQVKATVPFDTSTNLSFRDSIGPSYSVRMYVRELESARGRVKVSYARGSKGGKYRSLGYANIATKGTAEGTVTKRFRLGRGSYRLKFSYGGSPTVRAGSVTFKITIKRTFR